MSLDSSACHLSSVKDPDQIPDSAPCYFEEVAPNTYTFCRTRHAAILPPILDPKAERISFKNHEPAGTRWADLPSTRLLRLHVACYKLMDMAGAAEYVEFVIRDLERLELDGTLANDDSSDIGMVLRMKGLWSGFGLVDGEQEGGCGAWADSAVEICG